MRVPWPWRRHSLGTRIWHPDLHGVSSAALGTGLPGEPVLGHHSVEAVQMGGERKIAISPEVDRTGLGWAVPELVHGSGAVLVQQHGVRDQDNSLGDMCETPHP
ncbi:MULTISPECIES: hypothetical protein [Streptomyces]|uniref:hypothetical protein n=1 Tax=Streptomyces TaxID=1883 RepID=UPI0032569995